jgi:MoaA/NifB/PqqE/SkfB family radical SAM enzyme
MSDNQRSLAFGNGRVSFVRDKISRIKHIFLFGLSYKLRLLRPWCPPYFYSIESTNRCNFSCKFCPQSGPHHKSDRELGTLSTENFSLFLKRIEEVNPGSKKISICLDGEPLLNKDFPSFISLAKKAGRFPRFSSNGKLLTPDKVDELATGGGFLASVDFASDELVFETVRGEMGDFALVLKNLLYLLSKARMRKDINVEISDITPFVGADPVTSLRKMRSFFPAELPNNVTFFSRKAHNFGGHFTAGEKGKRYHLCPYPWSMLQVAWNGDVVACCRDTKGKTVLGNVFRNSVRDIWLGEEYVRFRKSLVSQRPGDVVACAHCDLPVSSDSSRWKLAHIRSSFRRG